MSSPSFGSTCKFVLLLAVVYVASLAGAQELHLPPTFTAKIKFRGRSSSDEEYEGIISKPDPRSWTLDAFVTQNDKTYKYSNGKLLVNNECFTDLEAIPPNSFINNDMLKTATLLNDDGSFDKEVNTCKQKGLRRWLLHYYAGEPFVLCTETVDNMYDRPVRLIGQNLIVEVLGFVLSRSGGTHALAEAVHKCKASARELEAVVPEVFAKSETRSVSNSWFMQPGHSCSLQWLKDDSACSQAVQNAEPTKICVFLHGIGQTPEEKGDPVPEFPAYWGNVHLYTPQCKERIFIREETKFRGWDSAELQQSYCKLSLYGQPDDDKLIKNKIIFTHSMGNLILSAAIRNGHCDVDNSTTTWYNIQGPFLGSKAAPVLSEICAKIASGKLPPWTGVYKLYKFIADVGGYCMPKSNESYPAYNTLNPKYPPLQDLYKISKNRVSGALCGISSFGINSRFSPLLTTLAAFVGYGDFNDGMVPWTSCARSISDKVKDKFTPDYTNNFYVGSLNHADGTCRIGDGLWGIHRKPCSYYMNKM